MAPHSSTLAWKTHGRRSLVGCSPWGRWESDTTERLHFHFSPACIGEGNGNPLQCSCLENPRDGTAWWAAVYGVAQSRTWLKRLSSSMRMWLELYLLASTAEKSLPQTGTASPPGAVCVCVSIWRRIKMKSLQKRMAGVVLKWTSLMTKFWTGKRISTGIHTWRSPLIDEGVKTGQPEEA